MVLSILGAMCWFVDPASNRGILVLFCSVFVAELILQYACLFDEIAVYPHKRLELSVLWNVSAESCHALLKRIRKDFGCRVVPVGLYRMSPLKIRVRLARICRAMVSVRGTPGFENLY